MKKLFLILSILGFASVSNGQLGEGVVKVLNEFFYQNPVELKIYENKGDNNPMRTISITGDAMSGFTVKGSDYGSWLNPEYFDLEYVNVIFRYDRIEDGWTRVIYDNGSAATGWISPETPLSAHSWSDFFTNVTTSVSPIGTADIKAGPDDNAKTIRESSSQDCFEAVEVAGDWLKIRTNQTLECNEHPNPIESGYIRWRDGNNLLVKYGLGA